MFTIIKVAGIIMAVALGIWEAMNTSLRVACGMRLSPVVVEFIYDRTHTKAESMLRALTQIKDKSKFNRFCARRAGIEDYDFNLCDTIEKAAKKMM